MVVSNTKFDSHANTIVSGEKFIVLYFTESAYYLAPYTEKYEPKILILVFYIVTEYTSACGRNKS